MLFVLHRFTGRHCVGLRLCCGWRTLTPLFLFWACICCAASKPKWEPVAPSDLADTSPQVEANAGAEAIFYRLEIDDKNYPHRRVHRLYSRVKIYEPERVPEILTTKTVSIGADADEHLELNARLHLANGEVKEFGKEAFLERTTEIKGGGGWWRIFRSGATKVAEKYLAVSGVERGAVLEYWSEWEEQDPSDRIMPFQFAEVPVRRLDVVYSYKPPRRHEPRWKIRAFWLDQGVADARGARLVEAPGEMRVTAENLPSIVPARFAGPPSDFVLSLGLVYDGGARAWSWLAGDYARWDGERGEATSRIKKQATALTADLKSDLVKAKRIHDFVQKLYREYRTVADSKTLKSAKDVYPDEVLDCVKTKRAIMRYNFLDLTLALCRASGLEARSVLLPDRSEMRFNWSHNLTDFLPYRVIGVQIDGRWHYSLPLMHLPFGMLPWMCEGQAGLLTGRSREQVGVPASEAERSLVKNFGDFKLAPDGSLEGACRSIFTGHPAVMMRLALDGESQTAQQLIMKDVLIGSFVPCTLEILEIVGAQGTEEPLTVKYTVKIEGYAAFTKEMITLNPLIFRTGERGSSPFSARERQTPVSFPYRWGENDEIEIEIPEGYMLSGSYRPPAYPGEILHYSTEIKYRPKTRRLLVNRVFRSNVLEVPAAGYPELKRWYDAVAAADAHEVTFKKQAALDEASAAAAPQ
jgi:hypothetical protein